MVTQKKVPVSNGKTISKYVASEPITPLPLVPFLLLGSCLFVAGFLRHEHVVDDAAPCGVRSAVWHG